MRMRQLQEELEKYGIKANWVKILYYSVILAVVIFAAGLFFELPIMYLIALTSGFVFISPFFIACILKVAYEEKRFNDINVYIEQFLYSFQKSNKILTSLKDVYRLFEKGEMNKLIGDVIHTVEHTFEDGFDMSDSLASIEQRYPVNLVCTMHKFCEQVERNGGENAIGISILLEARRLWADRALELMKAKRNKLFQIILSVVLSVFICWMMVVVGRGMNIDICAYTITRLTLVLSLWMDIIIVFRGYKKLSSPMCDSREPGEEIIRSYKKLSNHMNSGRHHPFDTLLKKRISKALKQVYPQWLLQMSLLLQSENVQVAIAKSYDDAPILMKPFIKDLLSNLRDNPSDMMPYVSFMKEYDLPEVSSSMKMLYSLSEGTGGQASTQIEDIIRRNQILIDQSEKMKNDDEIAGMYALFLAPQLTCGMKLVGDMLVMFYGLISTGMLLGG